MKIIIISRSIYPSQFPRSQRTTELAKELARQGYEVIVYAVLGSFNYTIFEKENNLKVRSIGKIRFTRSSSDGIRKNTLLNRVLTRLLKNLIEFPDIELLFKVPAILKKESNVDMLITIAYPYTLHWGAALAKARLKNKFPRTWVADCGDPYMGNKFQYHYFYFKYLEKWFCRKTDYITVPVEGAKMGYYSEFQNKIKVIPQGFSFENIHLPPFIPKNPRPTFAYAGTFFKGVRDPQLFLEYLSTLHLDFKFIIYTKNKVYAAPFIEKLGEKMELHDYILREDLLNVLSKMDFLVNFENKTEIHSPSKLIDYALTKRPILSINSNLLEKEKIINFLNGDYKGSLIIEDVEKYNIKNVAREFLKLGSLSK